MNASPLTHKRQMQANSPTITMNSARLVRHSQLGAWMLVCAGTVLLAKHSPAETVLNTSTESPALPYAAKDVARAFAFMDANKDGKISREEAAGFRGVARHFDAADSNRDSLLSRAEFESALNKKKPAEPAARAATTSQSTLK
jgi:hypothetical protein